MILTDEQKRAVMIAMYEKCRSASRHIIKERVQQVRKMRIDLLLTKEAT